LFWVLQVSYEHNIRFHVAMLLNFCFLPLPTVTVRICELGNIATVGIATTQEPAND
jgi:hypothetical protein